MYKTCKQLLFHLHIFLEIFWLTWWALLWLYAISRMIWKKSLRFPGESDMLYACSACYEYIFIWYKILLTLNHEYLVYQEDLFWLLTCLTLWPTVLSMQYGCLPSRHVESGMIRLWWYRIGSESFSICLMSLYALCSYIDILLSMT